MSYLQTNQKILVVGAYGMVGSAFVKLCRKQGYTRLLTPKKEQLDCTNQLAVREYLLEHLPDVVIIAAAKVGGIYSNAIYPAEFMYTNLMIAANLIHESFKAKVSRLLYLASTCIYPRDTAQPILEESLLTGPLEKTNEAYALAKISGVKLCHYYKKQYGCSYIAAMPTNLYGPGDHYHPENSHVIPCLMYRFYQAKLAAQPTVTFWGTGRAMREFLYVDDLAEACLILLKHYDKEDHINIGSGEEISIKKLANMIKEAIGYTGECVADLSKPEGTPRKKTETSRIQELGWRPKTELSEGLRHTYADFCERVI